MIALMIQIAVLYFLTAAVVMWAVYFPNPSPLVRRWLPVRKRWPEQQIRRWLENGRFHPSFLSYFYRDPERAPAQPYGLVAPADGLVTSADTRDGVRYLVIALSFWDMHVQRSPAMGKVVSVEASGDTFIDGEGREFAFLRAKRCPVQQRLMLATADGALGIRLITSLAARRIETWVKPGDHIDRGQRIGRILLGSTVVLELPPDAALAVNIGEHIRAGETIVATMASSTRASHREPAKPGRTAARAAPWPLGPHGDD